MKDEGYFVRCFKTYCWMEWSYHPSGIKCIPFVEFPEQEEQVLQLPFGHSSEICQRHWPDVDVDDVSGKEIS